MKKYHLYTPGPTPVPPNVFEAIAQPLFHHRHTEFIELFKRVNENLRYVFQTKNDVFTLTCSGTGAMETAVCNLLSPGDVALCVNGGKFGARWGEICCSYGIQVEEILVEWGQAVDPHMVGNKLRERENIKAVFITHTETSTGVAHDVREIARIVHESSGALVVVDGITSVGALELAMDDWGLDAVLTASQKGLMVPPGLAFIAVSERGWKQVQSSSLPRYYFDLRTARTALSGMLTSWTPATSLIAGLDVALQMIRDEGLKNIWERHQRLAAAMRAGCEALGLRLFPAVPSNALTVVVIPPQVDGVRLAQILRDEHGIAVAGGQAHLKGKIIRIAHLGYCHDNDIIAFLSSFEHSLNKCGWPCEEGSGVKASRSKLQGPFA